MKQNKKNFIVFITFLFLVQLSLSANAAPVIIGNGCDKAHKIGQVH